MKFSNRFARFAGLSTIALFANVCCILPADLRADEPNNTEQKPVVVQRAFTSPDDAIKALQAATEAKDNAALSEIFGPEVQELLTGDKVLDANNAQRFATALAQGCNRVRRARTKSLLRLAQTTGRCQFHS
jgi:hypothetical protein